MIWRVVRIFSGSYTQTSGELWGKLGDDDKAITLADVIDLFDNAICGFSPIHNLWMGYDSFDSKGVNGALYAVMVAICNRHHRLKI